MKTSFEKKTKSNVKIKFVIFNLNSLFVINLEW